MQELLDLADKFTIHDLQSNLNSHHIASSTVMYSDGDVSSHIDSDGYVEIDKITGEPSYFVYIDANNDIVLDIYKNISKTKLDEVKSHIRMMRERSGIPYHGPKVKTKQLENKNTPPSVQQKTKSSQTNNKDDGLIDINKFVCPVCNSQPNFYDAGNGNLVAICPKCTNLEYTFEPSRFYVMKATKAIYKDRAYSRRINIQPAKKS